MQASSKVLKSTLWSIQGLLLQLRCFVMIIILMTDHFLLIFFNLQSQKTAKLLMPPPRPKGRMTSSTYNVTGNMKTRNNNRPSNTIETNKRARYNPSTSSTSDDIGRSRSRPSSSTSYENIKSSVSDGPLQQTKPKRKRRPKKKKT